ncbi:unnamed protein product [Rhizophagus irregularis]|nr:unnamed protein product [Rhizophagus irregularis]
MEKKIYQHQELACIGSNEYSNTAELTALENSSLEASIHAPASGSVSSHSPADPSSTTRAPLIEDKLTLNEARSNEWPHGCPGVPCLGIINRVVNLIWCLNVGASEILTSYAIMAINQGNFEGQLKM